MRPGPFRSEIYGPGRAGVVVVVVSGTVVVVVVAGTVVVVVVAGTVVVVVVAGVPTTVGPFGAVDELAALFVLVSSGAGAAGSSGAGCARGAGDGPLPAELRAAGGTALVAGSNCPSAGVPDFGVTAAAAGSRFFSPATPA